MSQYKEFFGWLFDNNKTSPIPKSEELLKYNSPITHTYVIGLFVNNANLNHYLNTYLNNIGLRYLDKAELFRFIKKCVIDFKVNKRSIPFSPFKHKTKLFDVLRKKVPILKNNDISLLCDVVEKSKDKEKIYVSLNLEKPKKIKISQKKKTNKKISLQEFLDKFFSVVEMK